MATPIIPRSLIIYKMIRENEKTNRTVFPVDELFAFAHNVLEIAGEIDGEKYFIVSANKYSTDYHETMSRLCDIHQDYYELNSKKLEQGGRAYADRVIGAMPYSFLKGAVQVLEEELQDSCEETQCV